MTGSSVCIEPVSRTGDFNAPIVAAFRGSEHYRKLMSTDAVVDIVDPALCGEEEPPPPPVDQARFLHQSVPAFMIAGSTHEVSVTMRNTATTTWLALRDRYALGSQVPDNNPAGAPPG